MIKLIKRFMKGVYRSLWSFIKDIFTNWPATVILVLAASGLVNVLSKTTLQLAFVPIPFINEGMIVVFTSVTAIYLLAWIAISWSRVIDNVV